MSHIDLIKASLSRHNPVKTSHFAVFITPPAIAESDIVREIPFMADSTNLPVSQFSVDAIKHKGFGLEEQRPAMVQFDQITITLRADAQGKTFDFIEKWKNSIFNKDEDDNDDLPSETFNYPVEYWGTLEIHLYDNTMRQYRTYKMTKVFPQNMGSPTLDWQGSDQFMKFSVSFSYRTYKATKGNSLSESLNSSNTLSDRDPATFQLIENQIRSGNITGLY